MMGGVNLVPRWFRPLLLALAAVLLVGWFSPEISDPDFWWHLRTGQYILKRHSLPVPDPFAYTTAMARPVYAGEEHTRDFNLTHEWLAQVLFYLIYRAAGFGGVVLFRAMVLVAFCALAGLMAWRRCGGFYGALAAAFATAGVASEFAVDRPYLVTFLLLASTIAILETRRFLWLLPPLFLIWANCHGGYFLGWTVLAAYSAEALFPAWRKKPLPGARRLWIVSAVSVLVSGVNPNGFRVLQILLYYRNSYLTSRLLEWAAPPLWPPREFAVLLFGAAALLLWARRGVRLADWVLFAAFALAGLSAQRNTFLIGFLAPVLIVSYFPWKPRLPVFAQYAAAALMVGALGAGIARGSFFQLRAAEWRYPAGAADFLLAHHVTGPLFNTYEYGGYLIWRLWPQERVFIDGRALSESIFMDYVRILYNHDASGGKSAEELLDGYGVQAMVMNCFEYTNGLVYLLAPALANPAQTDWKLVYSDAQAMVFMRHPPPGVEPLDSLRVLDHMEAECALHIDRKPWYPRCARGLGQVFARIGDFTRERRWIGVYLAHPHDPDPEAEQEYQRLLFSGR
jgi:hypothetical protein